ncbi:MAG: hypothetical protein R3F21_18510 [Myxococcota bacterium]
MKRIASACLILAIIVVLIFAGSGCQLENGGAGSEAPNDGEPKRTDGSDSLLPTSDLQEALAGLDLVARDRSVVSVEMTAFPAESLFAGVATADKPIRIPIQARRQVMLQLRPTVTADSLSSILRDFDLEPVQSMPELGIVIAQERDMTAAAEASVTLPDATDFNKLEVSDLIDRLRSDPRILSAAPDSILSPLVLKAAAIPTPDLNAGAVGEQQDWGINDARISDVWPMLSKPLSVGVIDVGIGEHADLVLRNGLTASVRKADHGTHVSGIMCAQHNTIGVRGALKNCTVVYSSSQNILQRTDPVEGNDIVGWSAFFSEYLATTLDFMHE